MKKLVCLTIALIMLLSCFVVTGSAESAEQAYPDIVVTPGSPYAWQWNAGNSVDTLQKDTDTFGETVYKLVGGSSSSYSGYIDISLKNIPYAYKYVKAEVYYEKVSDSAKTSKPAAQISQVSASPDGDAASNWKNMTYCGSDKLFELCGNWETVIFSMDYSDDSTSSGYLESSAGGGYLRQMRLSLTGWGSAQDCVIYIKSLTFVKDTVEVMESVGIQSTRDYGKNCTVSAADVTPDVYRGETETVENTQYDGRNTWHYKFVGGSTYGSFWLPVGFSLDDYNYVTYDIYVVSSNKKTCTPVIQADVGDANAKGYITDLSTLYTAETGKWQSVTLKLSEYKTGNVTCIQMFPFCEINGIEAEYYVSDITFFEKMPGDGNECHVLSQSTPDINLGSGWNNGGVLKLKFDGVAAWKMLPGSTYAGDLQLNGNNGTTNVSVDYSKYKYVTYYMYIDSEQTELELNPTLEKVSSGRVDKNSDGTYTGAKRTFKTNQWVEVTVKVSDDVTFTSSNHLFWPMGSYAKDIDFNCVYISAVTFSEKPLESGADKQSLRFVSVLKDGELGNYTEVGYKISAKKNGVVSDQVLTVSAKEVYSSVHGADETYTPESFGGAYFSALRIDDVPIGEALEITVIAYVKTQAGQTVEALPVTYKILSNGMLV